MSSEIILRLPAVLARIGIGRSTLYAKLDIGSAQYDPTFPEPVKLGARAVGWRESEIVAWMDDLDTRGV